MGNRILGLTVTLRRVDPAEAEVWVEVWPERMTARTEVRGRLVGPRCPGVQTVEVAYPLRPPPKKPTDLATDVVRVRAVIPEPNLWTTATPFEYTGPVELWQDGECADVTTTTVRLTRAVQESG